MSTNIPAQLLPLMASFVRVVECGSFSEAARQKGSTASALSRQIAGLEQALGLRLLERTTRKLRLSEAGGEVFEHCREMLGAAQAAMAVGERLMSHPRGRVRLPRRRGCRSSSRTLLRRCGQASPAIMGLFRYDRSGDRGRARNRARRPRAGRAGCPPPPVRGRPPCTGRRRPVRRRTG